MNRKTKRASNLEAPSLRLIKYLHWVLTVLIFALFWFPFRYGGGVIPINRAFRYNLFVIAFYGLIFGWLAKTFNAYTLGYFRIRHMTFSQSLADFFSIVFVYFGVSIGWLHFNNPARFLIMLCVQAVLNAGWSYYANLFYYRIYCSY